MTDNNKIQANSVVDNTIQANLTEQLTKQLASWSLPEYTEFYVRKKDGSTDTQTWINRRHSSPIEWWNTFNITEVLAPVPSYEEWKASEKYNKHLEEVIKIYERKEKQATETSIAYNDLLEENAQLKELLKECRGEISPYKDFISGKKTFKSLINKINQALGEDE